VDQVKYVPLSTLQQATVRKKFAAALKSVK
jgi:hypothetical protein